MPEASEAAEYGLTVEEASGPPVGIWPDNVASVNVFVAMSTQWRVGMVGATGLDYNTLPFAMRNAGIKRADQSGVFDDIRILEDAALETMRKDR